MNSIISQVGLVVLIALVIFGVMRQKRQQKRFDNTVSELFSRVAAKHGWISEPTNDRKAPIRLRGQLGQTAGWALEYRLRPREERSEDDSQAALGFSDTAPYLCW